MPTAAAQSTVSSSATNATSRTLRESVSLNAEHVQWRIRRGELKSRGVNLGGWLVAENWMTKEADFWRGLSDQDAGGGEYTAITKARNPDTIRSNLDYHHSTFITEGEIRAIAEAGFNTVRVPVGYWIVGFDNNDPSGRAEWKAYTAGTIKYLDALIQNWAKKYNVAVLISIHGAKGSQNGADHSSPSVPGQSYWSQYRENVDNTWAVSSFLAARYRYEDAFLGIGLLNEPSGTTNEGVLYQHYQDIYWGIRNTGNDCVLTVAPLLWKQDPNTMVGFMEGPTFKNVWVEWHPYFVWGYEQTSEWDLINVSVKRDYQNKVNAWNWRGNHNRLFFGEWSFATAGKFGNNKEQFYEFAQAQLNVLNQAQGGWTFWSWRVYGDENGFNGWSLRSVLRDPRFKQMLQASNAQ
ncbi:hypothetical protein PybrP1_013060 [[Pythium] brassicae (nom. inval.)]|nr:hypothetical protein PybrP1_013060 [[Pythium] brassicae (nom. inval.)]